MTIIWRGSLLFIQDGSLWGQLPPPRPEVWAGFYTEFFDWAFGGGGHSKGVSLYTPPMGVFGNGGCSCTNGGERPTAPRFLVPPYMPAALEKLAFFLYEFLVKFDKINHKYTIEFLTPWWRSGQRNGQLYGISLTARLSINILTWLSHTGISPVHFNYGCTEK